MASGFSWEQLLASVPGPTNNHLCTVIESSRELREIAGHKLWESKYLNHQHLRCLIRYVDSLRNPAWERLLKEEPTTQDLFFVMKFVPPLSEAAWQRYLQVGTTVSELRYLVRLVEPVRDVAWQKLWEIPASLFDIHEAAAGNPRLCEDIKQRLKDNTSTDEVMEKFCKSFRIT